ncbi:MAG: hypothetical protein ACYC8T_07460 [Myxococcaceae bacterium]
MLELEKFGSTPPRVRAGEVLDIELEPAISEMKSAEVVWWNGHHLLTPQVARVRESGPFQLVVPAEGHGRVLVTVRVRFDYANQCVGPNHPSIRVVNRGTYGYRFGQGAGADLDEAKADAEVEVDE